MLLFDKNMLKTNPNAYHFLFAWTLQSVAVWLLGAVLCFILWIPVHLVLIAAVQYLGLDSLASALGALVMLGLPGIVLGRCIGWIQHDLLRNQLDWEMPAWIRYSTIGGAIGGLAVVLIELVFSRWWGYGTLMLAMPVFVAGLSLCQWLILRRHARDAWVWVWGNLCAGIVFSGLLAGNGAAAESPFVVLGSWALAAAAQSFITGVVVLWLYDRPLPERSPHRREPARVFVEVYSQPQRPDQPNQSTATSISPFI